jgi:hypothetical protein
MLTSPRTIQRPTLLAAGLLAASLAFAPALSASPHAIDIAAARHMALGSVVTVIGSATVPSGTFASSFGDEGFAIQDHTGGIYVSTPTNLHVRYTQEVRVTGTLTDSGGLLTIVPASPSEVDRGGRGRRFVPRWVSTASIGEGTEGLIVRVVGKIVEPIEPDLPFGYKVFVDDGTGPIRIFINTTTDIDITTLAEGQTVSVVGFSGQFDTYEIDPRFASDIHIRH